MTVSVDIIEGAGGSHHLVHGWVITRVAKVTGLYTVVQDTGQTLQAAEEALTAVVGPRGSACPGIDSDIPTYLEQFVPEIVTQDMVQFRIIYKGYPLPSYEFGSCLAQRETMYDKDGNVIYVEYDYPSDYAPDPRGVAGLTIRQTGLVNRPKAEETYTVHFTAFANSGPGFNNATEAATYYLGFVGHPNLNTFTIGLRQGGPRQWMVVGARARSNDGGLTYQISWTVQYREDYWDQLVVFINPDDGKPPPDLVDGRGKKLVEMEIPLTYPVFLFGEN